MKGICKSFGDLLALNQVDFSVRKGEIQAVLGENGAGKSTLMNLLFGLAQPDSGKIFLKNKEVLLSSPFWAHQHGIAMVHQHFMLSPSLTVAENIALALKQKGFGFFNAKKIEQLAQRLADEYGLSLNPRSKVKDLSVGEQQRIEILKALALDCELLILDEPTSLLTPQEIELLFNVFRKFKSRDKTIVFITHKISEVMQLCDRATILKRGEIKGVYEIGSITEAELSSKMIQKDEKEKEVVLKKDSIKKERSLWLSLKAITVKNSKRATVLNELSLSLYRGEIVGVVGVEGNGQQELVEAVLGHARISKGKRDCLIQRMGYIPSDRQQDGLVLPLSLKENFLLEKQHLKECSTFRFLNQSKIKRFAQHLIRHYSISPKNEEGLVCVLSGGNQQKVVVSRELAMKPEAVVAVNPTWGLDVESTLYVHEQLRQLAVKDKGLLLVTIDLEEALTLSDRLFVIYKGGLKEIAPQDWSFEKIGLAMSGLKS